MGLSELTPEKFWVDQKLVTLSWQAGGVYVTSCGDKSLSIAVQVEQVSVLRHGARTPEHFLCNTVQRPPAASERRRTSSHLLSRRRQQLHAGGRAQGPASVGNWTSQEANYLT